MKYSGYQLRTLQRALELLGEGAAARSERSSANTEAPQPAQPSPAVAASAPVVVERASAPASAPAEDTPSTGFSRKLAGLAATMRSRLGRTAAVSEVPDESTVPAAVEPPVAKVEETVAAPSAQADQRTAERTNRAWPEDRAAAFFKALPWSEGRPLLQAEQGPLASLPPKGEAAVSVFRGKTPEVSAKQFFSALPWTAAVAAEPAVADADDPGNRVATIAPARALPASIAARNAQAYFSAVPWQSGAATANGAPETDVREFPAANAGLFFQTLDWQGLDQNNDLNFSRLATESALALASAQVKAEAANEPYEPVRQRG